MIGVLKKRSIFMVIAIAMITVFALAGCGGDGGQAGTKGKIEKPEDLQGKKVGVQVGTTADESAEKFLETTKFELTKYDQIIQPFSDLKTGRLDAIIVDEVVARYYVATDPSSYAVTGARLTNEPIGICIKKENAALRDAVDDAIVELRKEGKLKELSEKWFGEDLTANVDGMATEVTGKGKVPEGMKVLRVGVDDTYPPMEFRDEKNNIVGFDVDLATEVAKKLGLEVEFISTAWDGIFTSLNTDKFDCIVSSISINEERQQNFSLTKAYIANAQVIVIAPDK